MVKITIQFSIFKLQAKRLVFLKGSFLDLEKNPQHYVSNLKN